MPLDCEEDFIRIGEQLPPDVYEKSMREYLRKLTPKPPPQRKQLPKHLPCRSAVGNRKESEEDYEDIT